MLSDGASLLHLNYLKNVVKQKGTDKYCNRLRTMQANARRIPSNRGIRRRDLRQNRLDSASVAVKIPSKPTAQSEHPAGRDGGQKHDNKPNENKTARFSPGPLVKHALRRTQRNSAGELLGISGRGRRPRRENEANRARWKSLPCSQRRVLSAERRSFFLPFFQQRKTLNLRSVLEEG